MKNIQLIAFLFCLWLLGGVMNVFAQTNTPKVALRSDYDFDKNEIINSTKISIPFFVLKGSLLSDFSKEKVDFENIKWNYGLEFSTQKLFPKLQIILKTGNLTGTGKLPQYNSFSAPQSYYGEINWTLNQIIKKLSFNVIYKSDKEKEYGTFISSSLLKLKPFNKATLTLLNSTGVYPYDQKKISTWFSAEKFYRNGMHICFTNQISITGNRSSSVFTVGTYQSPFGDFLNTWQTKNTLKLKDFSFILNVFYNPNDEVLSSADKKIKPLLQIDCDGQYKTFTGIKNPYLLTVGINSQANINLAEKNHTIKTQGNLQYSGDAAKWAIKTVLNFNLTDEADGIKVDFSGGSIEASNSCYIKDFIPTITGKFSFTPDSKKTKWTYTEKIGFNFEYEEPVKKISFTNKNAISFTQKTGDLQNKTAFTSSLTAKFQFRFCSLHVHLEFQV